MPESSAQQAVEQLRSGRTLLVLCDDVAAGRIALSAALQDVAPGVTLVELDWVRTPPLTDELDEIRDALADAALALWPDWYVSADARTGENSTQRDAQQVLAQAGGIAGISKAWLGRATKRCAAGQPPTTHALAVAEQVRQLAIALDPSQLVIMLSVEEEEASDGRLRGLARAAEWLSQQTQARTLLVVPQAWATRAELDPVAYGAVSWSAMQPAEKVPNAAPEAEGVGRAGARETARWPAHKADFGPKQTDKAKVRVGPILGRPHPGSRVEQLVARCLQEDAELAGLFEYNQPLRGLGDQRYLVDLLWREGGLIVEIDGHEHRAPDVFVRDRDRDYRLCMRGYTTLRVSNDEVLSDVRPVLQKIRNMVGFLRNRPTEQDGKT